MMRFLILASLLAVAVSEVINVHMVSHSHDDPGWLKTVDQYYSGSNTSIYPAYVQYIFDSVVVALDKDSTKHYTMCEVSFFSRWWNEQNEETKVLVKKLVDNDQLHFVNGGWVMHDEAASHYISMIDQTTLGHRFLKESLDYYPTVGWQIDPFGHANTHAWLSSEVGFDSLFFGRIDYQDKDKRMAEKAMEMVWKGSKSQPSAEVLAGAFSSGNYGPPSGFCMDVSCVYCLNDPIVDDKLLETYNLEAKAEAFVKAIYEEQEISLGYNIMMKMGADFTYTNANTWYKSIDILMKYINEKYAGELNLFYSDPVTYTKARAAEDLVWPEKTDDFFPYSDASHTFWTGYFTSRPTLKYLERISSSLLTMMKPLSSYFALKNKHAFKSVKEMVFSLTAGVGLVNHHDAITGTSKQHVAYDYFKILSKALTSAESFVGNMFADLLGSKSTSNTEIFQVCRFTNESYCEATQSLNLRQHPNAMIVLYNNLPRTASQQVSVFLNNEASLDGVSITVTDTATNTIIPSEILPTATFVKSINKNAAPFTLVFQASNVPAMGASKYMISMTKQAVSSSNNKLEEVVINENRKEPVVISNDIISISFDSSTGLMQSMKRLDCADVIEIDISNEFGYYRSFGSPAHMSVPVDKRDPHLANVEPAKESLGEASTQPSGAYIFRPAKADDKPNRIYVDRVELSVVKGDSIVEVRQKFSDWVYQIVRLREGQAAVEFEWQVGPIPIADGYGKEVINKFSTSIDNGGTGSTKFYTDSNGREYMERLYNYRPTWDMKVYEPVAGNYYPLTTGMYIKDETKDIQFSVLTDRAEGGASLENGEIELMVHRRLLRDDWKGVSEPLNETTIGITPYPTWNRQGPGITVIGKQYVLLSSITNGMKEVRSLMDKLFSPLYPLYTTNEHAIAGMKDKDIDSLLGEELPLNVNLLSLELLTENELLVRVSHQFAVDEDPVYSEQVTFDLFNVLSKFNPIDAVETTLSGTQLKETREQNKIIWKSASESKNSHEFTPIKVTAEGNFMVTLNPMHVRTFIVKISN